MGSYPAPAKLNLFLHVVGRRPDGYHLLQTVFRFIDHADVVHLALREDGRIVRCHDLPGVSEDQDLTIRAARLLQAASGTRLGVEIRLEKRLPQGGGLGGGSSDAATVLLALNRGWRLDWPRAQAAGTGPILGGGCAGVHFWPIRVRRRRGGEAQPACLATGLVCGVDAARKDVHGRGFRCGGIDTKHASHHNSGLFCRLGPQRS